MKKEIIALFVGFIICTIATMFLTSIGFKTNTLLIIISVMVFLILGILIFMFFKMVDNSGGCL